MSRRNRRRRAKVEELEIHAVPVTIDPRIGFGGHKVEFMNIRDLCEPGTRDPINSPENVNVDRVSWLYAHEQVERRQYEAAQRLAHDWQRGEMIHYASSVMVGAGGTNDHHPTDEKLDCITAYKNARRALGHAWPVVELVVQCGLTVEQSAPILRVHPKRYMGMLWIALHILADHYGMPGEYHQTGYQPARRAASA